jgi:hypothetical protein
MKGTDPMQDQNDRAPQGEAGPGTTEEDAQLARLALTPETVRQAARALRRLDWSQGLTRRQIHRRYPQLAPAIFLRLPDSKRYTSVGEMLHDAGIAASRAEGEYLGAHPDIPEEESLEEGGPPAWGPTPLFTPGAWENGGSAEDSTALLEGE